MADCLMPQLVTFPIQERGNILDLVITNIPERVIGIYPGDRLSGSDYSVIHLCLAMEGTTPVPKTVFNWCKANFTGIRTELSSVPWGDLLGTLSTEKKWAVFRDCLQAAVNIFVPV